MLDPAEICDLLKGVVVLVCCVLMNYIDVSMMYHLIRGQTVIKLYIFFNMLDVSIHIYIYITSVSVLHTFCFVYHLYPRLELMLNAGNGFSPLFVGGTLFPSFFYF